MSKVSHKNTFYFLRHEHVRYTKSFFINSEAITYVENYPSFKDICKLHGQITWEFLGLRIRNFQGIAFI